MELRRLHLQDFKNYPSLELVLSSGVQFILGLNGTGKTNILDAIHVLSFTKSFQGLADGQCIRFQAPFFLVKGDFFSKNEVLNVLVYQESGKKKVIKANNVPYDKVAHHIGTIPLVLISPDDEEIIKGGSEIRRKWLDGCIAQTNSEYLTVLINYQRLLANRNQLLKQIDGNVSFSVGVLLETYDQQLAPLNEYIWKTRSHFLQLFESYFLANLKVLAPEQEQCVIHFQTQRSDGSWLELMEKSQKKDVMLQRTSVGIHRDDLIFMLNDQPVRKFGSQGQQKSFLIALRLAQYDYLKSNKDEKPLLLLDDLFDKLDDDRIRKLVNLLVNNERFGQVIITDARRERSLALGKELGNVTFFEILNGSIRAL